MKVKKMCFIRSKSTKNLTHLVQSRPIDRNSLCVVESLALVY